MMIKAYAKVNLFLHIVGKRQDGYHLLESLIAFTSITDFITIKTSDTLSIKFINTDIDVNDNTIYKAVNLLSQYCNKKPNFSIHIHKNIPIAAGLGGGSADAAAIMLFLCRRWKIQITQKIYDIALKIGADVPICLYQCACFVEGIGENITKIKQFPTFIAVLVNPGIPINTQEAFHHFTGGFTTRSISINSYCTHILELITNSTNDLQQIIESLYPEVKTVINTIRKQKGCIIARMSGSGSTCFGIFNDIRSAKEAEKALSMNFPWVRLSKLY